MKISTTGQMRDMDRRAIEEYGISDELLMENASLASFHVISSRIGVEGRKFVFFCGPGNNGGDGLALARKVHSEGGEVTVFLTGNPDKYGGAAGKNFEIASGLPIDIFGPDDIDRAAEELSGCHVVVDALFGTGITREVEGRFAEIIDDINSAGKCTVSVDIPSGINGDSAQVMGTAVRADFTITFGLPKTGNILYPGFDYCGELYVTHISFPPELYRRDDIMLEAAEPEPLPARDGAGHKGSFGQVLFVAGARGYYGAPYFSALSFLKAGGGYSRLATPISAAQGIASEGKEIVFIPLPETDNGSLSIRSAERILEIAGGMDMVVVGPGLSLDEETGKLVRLLIEEIECPLLIDGDGITAAAQEPEVVIKRKGKTVLTPHPGEMSRICGRSIPEIGADSVGILREQAARLNAVIVLKGAHTLTGCPDGRVYVNMSGNAGMASAGSGDVLTGCISAMHGLGLPLEQAVVNGVFMHGLAGDLAAEQIGRDGITAGDIMEFLPLAIRSFRDNRAEILKDCYHTIFRI
ncbi:MAG: NAD(P)H-hydrate dehydratase [Candidatus Latescibacteria bacterium]|nr:NAD(P)H-hydrate dehydratase [bacterium]MBD3423204.1 NAD(P)H-hydrate dehydratase [Candidatus Latescibacterota bacterium]